MDRTSTVSKPLTHLTVESQVQLDLNELSSDASSGARALTVAMMLILVSLKCQSFCKPQYGTSRNDT